MLTHMIGKFHLMYEGHFILRQQYFMKLIDLSQNIGKTHKPPGL